MPTPPPGTPDLNLTTAGSFGEFNGAVFATGQTQPSGTGNFDSFVQIQHNGVEQGYNTDANAQYDEKNSHNHNHSILLAEVPIVIGDGTNGTVEGVAYREFRLDLNEANGGYISLDSLQIWQNEAGNLTNFTAGSGFAGAHTNYLAYDLDAGGDKWIALKDGAGSGSSDYRILIPDSYFINDAAHRYVTLYSKFGVQSGWSGDGGFEEWGTNGPNGGSVSAFSVQKLATVNGGTADTVGEVIHYAIAVSNTGNTNLTGVTVSDPSVSDLHAVLSGAFNVGDTNTDGVLSVGETWQYAASHTVTQSDIESNGGGDGLIDNIVTVDTTQTSPIAASASVVVEQRHTLELTKTPDVTAVNAAGDVISYAITVTNTGNTAVTGVEVNDDQVNIVTPIYDLNAPILGPEFLAPILVGDYNIGDTNQNGFQDPGETFQFKNAGDENNNGIEDPGETFLYTNVGDTNQNGAQDTGETFQYYNAGDTNHNGTEDPGETFQFQVSHAATATDANNDTFNDGDLDHDGELDVGETWLYTVTYTTTQGDIDNGGVVNTGLTHDNTATATSGQGASGEASASVSIVQDPRIALVKDATVADGTADEAGDVINYTISISNTGNMTLTGLTVTDPSVSNLAYDSGDANNDGKLDLSETWIYTASHTITQAELDNGGVVAAPGTLTIDNTASVTTAQSAADADASASDSASVTLVQNPHLTLTKTASVPGGTADTAGEVISYAITIENDGNMTLTGVSVADPSVSNLAAVESGGFNAGDTDMDGVFDVGELWQYSASHTVTQSDIDTNGGGDGTIDNTATVTTTQGATSNDSASVTVEQPVVVSLLLDKSDNVGTHYVDHDEDGIVDSDGDLIQFAFQITNNGTVTLTGVTINDPLLGGNVYGPDTLDPGETFTFALNYFLTASDVTAGHVLNTATASGFDPSMNAVNVMTQYDVLL